MQISAIVRVFRGLGVAVAVSCLAACGAGGGMATPVPSAPATANQAPTISGNGGATLTVGQAYTFTPTASDPDGNALSFSITGKPGWTTFSASTGTLSGTPGAADTGVSSVVITASDGSASAQIAFAITVNPVPTTPGNSPPVVSGNGTATVVAGTPYSFTPTASDPEGAALTFSITGRPAWLTFDTRTGALTGTPAATDAGAYAMVISASDGLLSASLSLTVTVTTTGTKSATLSWTPPTQRTDGSALTNLSGYRIYYGTSSSSLTRQANVSNASLTTYVVEGLAAGTWYFAATAVDSSGIESARTPTVSIALN